MTFTSSFTFLSTVKECLFKMERNEDISYQHQILSPLILSRIFINACRKKSIMLSSNV